MLEITHRFIDTNGIRMHIAEQGAGPLVILCHGFPELWYSWRHQVPALAAAGFHVVAPDQRGYGQTDCPEPVEKYDIFQLTGDIVGLVHALGESQAVIIGHDWGTIVASHCALFRPDIFKAFGLLSVPYIMRSWGKMRPTELMQLLDGGNKNLIFYQLYFQDKAADAEMDHDVRTLMPRLMYGLSGDAPQDKRWRPVFERSKKLTGSLPEEIKLPGWLKQKDLDYLCSEFERTGFRGGINWYRNLDRNWELTPFLTNAKPGQPSLFITGEADPTMSFLAGIIPKLDKNMPNLKKKIIMPGVGHWIQEERPDDINKLLIEFLREL
jgi:pimeloyl-ACP methyl ester carboxylesterase